MKFRRHFYVLLIAAMAIASSLFSMGLEELSAPQSQGEKAEPWEQSVGTKILRSLVHKAPFDRQTQRMICEWTMYTDNKEDIRASWRRVVSRVVHELIEIGFLNKRVETAGNFSLTYDQTQQNIEMQEGHVKLFGRNRQICDLAAYLPHYKEKADFQRYRKLLPVHLIIMKQDGYVFILDFGSHAETHMSRQRKGKEEFEEEFEVTMAIFPADEVVKIRCVDEVLILQPKQK